MAGMGRKLRIMLLTAAAVALACGSATADWNITDLSAALTSTGSGISSVGANSINNNGDVVGRATFPDTGNYHAALWQNGTVYDLGVLGNPLLSSQASSAHYITDSGMIVGEAYSDTTSTTNMYRQAVIFSVGSSPVNIHSTMTYDANNSVAGAASNGYIVGQAFNDTAIYQHAVVWGDGTGSPSSWTTVTDKNPQGTESTSPSAILSVNSSGQMVGWNILNPLGRWAYPTDPDRYQRATLWDTDGLVKYLDLSNDSRYTSIDFSVVDGRALDINDAGQILVRFSGFGDNIVNGLAGIWEKDGSFTEIPHLAGFEDLSIGAMNNLGQAVGSVRHQAPEGDANHAVLYDNGNLIDLTALFEGTGWDLTNAIDINDKGQMLVRAKGGSAETVLVLTPNAVPTPIPAALPLFASGLAALGVCRRRFLSV